MLLLIKGHLENIVLGCLPLDGYTLSWRSANTFRIWSGSLADCMVIPKA